MTLSRPPAAEHYPAAGQTGKLMWRLPAQEQRANLQGTPGNDSGIRERDCGRSIIVLKQT